MVINLLKKTYRYWVKLLLKPIRVYCLHHVSERYDKELMYLCDWMSLLEFKKTIIELQYEGYHFISLTDAYYHIQNDFIRRKKYAVLTFDDGYKSFFEVLPWLEEQQIPVTLFINGKYLDGKSYRDTPQERYLTYDELFALNSQLIEIGNHGWEHTPANEMTKEEFIYSINKNIDVLCKHPRYIPYWAYTYGNNTAVSNSLLQSYDLIPVMVTGLYNINNSNRIEREPLFYTDNTKIALGMCKNKDVCENCIYKLKN